MFFHCFIKGEHISERFRYCCIVGCQNDKRRVETSGGATGVGGTNPGMPGQRAVGVCFELDPFPNALFLFCGRRLDHIKGLYREKGGLHPTVQMTGAKRVSMTALRI